jgi:hypothetical protein
VARPSVARLAGWLSAFGEVRALDFRGHGRPGGRSGTGGDRDEYFPLEHFRTPAQAAGPSATAWVVPGFGHAESGATAPLVERIGRWASATIDP